MRASANIAPTARGRALTRLALRQVYRGALAVAVVSAVMSALVAVQYRTTFQGSVDASGLRALTENPAIRILFGTPVALDSAGGFTVWRTGIPLLVLGSVWILLAATRITRGEEDAGRCDLVLAAPLRMVDMVARALTAVAAAAVLISAAAGAALVLAGTDMAGAITYAAVILGVTLTFGCTGLLAAQVLPTRSAAVGVTVALLGAALLVRMLADAVTGAAWSAWATPFGLAARVAPFDQNRVAPLAVLASATLTLAAAALVVAQRRDVGSGLVVVATRRRPRTRSLRSLTGFAVRHAARPTIGWAVGIAGYFALIGALIASVLEFFETNRHFARMAAAAGFADLDSANGFAAALFVLLPIPAGLYGVTRLARLVADERSRRLTLVLAAPIARTRLIGTEIAMAAAGVVTLHVTAGMAMWAGATLTGAPLTSGAALAGALNTAPISALAVGAAAVAVGWLPPAVGVLGALPVAGGFLFDVVAQSIHAPQWVVSLSPFAHVAAVPQAPPDVLPLMGFVGTGMVLTGVGLFGYRRRDVAT